MFDAPSASTPLPTVPQTPPPPPMFGAAQTAGKKPRAQSQQQTFLGTGMIPDQGALGGKTLLGQ